MSGDTDISGLPGQRGRWNVAYREFQGRPVDTFAHHGG
jgi:hypothetical protein